MPQFLKNWNSSLKCNWIFKFLKWIFRNWKNIEWHSIFQKSSGDRQGDRKQQKVFGKYNKHIYLITIYGFMINNCKGSRFVTNASNNSSISVSDKIWIISLQFAIGIRQIPQRILENVVLTWIFWNFSAGTSQASRTPVIGQGKIVKFNEDF